MQTSLKLNGPAQASLVVLALLALAAGLWVASPILAPTALALVVGIVVAPLMNRLTRVGLPLKAAAIATFLATVLSVGLLIVMFQPTVAALVEQAPRIWADLRGMVDLIRGFFRGVADVTAAVSEAIVPEARADSAGDNEVTMPTLTDALMLAPGLLSQIMVFIGVLFFFLMSRSEVYGWAASMVEGRRGGGDFASRLDFAESEVSRYFLTIATINAGLGVATWIALQTIGLPGAATWGLVAFLINFLPYLGPAMLAVGLLLAGVVSFQGGAAFLPVAAFVTLNALEGQFVTPAFVGSRLSINPLVVFLSLVFGIWLWGPVGGIIAIPVLLWLRSVTNPPPEPEPEPVAA